MNDSVTNGDVYTDAPGNDDYHGTNVCCPKEHIQAILDTYTVGAGDIIYVDTGYYKLTNTVTVTQNGNAATPLVIQGSTNFAAGSSVIYHQGNEAFSFQSDYVRLTDVTVTGGTKAIVFDGASNCTLSNVVVSGASDYGCSVQDSSMIIFRQCRIFKCQNGVEIDNSTNYIRTSTIAYNTLNQLEQKSGYLNLRNSIVVVNDAGAYGIKWTDGRYEGDYNNLYIDASGKIGSFNAVDYTKLYNWQIMTTQDVRSLSHDPLFPSDTNFHLPTAYPGSISVDTNGAWTDHSPCIDAGDPASSFINEPVPNGSRVNLGVYGNTPEAAQSVTGAWVLAVSLNDGAEVTEGAVDLRWRSNLTGAEQVNLEYAQYGKNGITWSWQMIASGIPATNEYYHWTTTNVVGSPLARWRVVSASDTSIWDANDTPFQLRPYTFYVNDNSTIGDEYCSAVGALNNWGASSNLPQASLYYVFLYNDIEGGDRIYVDNGSYSLSQSIVINQGDSGSSSNGYVTLVGTTNTILTRLGYASPVFDLNSAEYISINQMELRNGDYGISANGSSSCTFNDLIIRDANLSAVELQSSDSNALARIKAFDCNGMGIDIDGSTYNTIENSVIAFSGSHGISVDGGSDFNEITSCTIANNGGEQVYMSGGLVTIYNTILVATNLGQYCLFVDEGSYVGDYNDLYAANGSWVGYQDGVAASVTDWQMLSSQDAYSLGHNPLFADTTTDDFHLKSVQGRWTGSGFFKDSVHSPCIDTGNSASTYTNEPSPNGSRINIGAYGNTTQASMARTNAWVLAINYNDQGVMQDSFTLRWTSGNANPTDLVEIRYSSDGGTNWSYLTTTWVSTESFTWDASAFPSSGNGLWRIVLTHGADVYTSVVDQAFAIHPAYYYVNDDSVMNDVYCTAIGDDVNRGFRADAPMASLDRLLAIHDLEPNNVVYIDTGDYLLSTNVTVQRDDSGATGNQYVYLKGSTNYMAGGTQWSRDVRTMGANALNLEGVGYVYITDLTITNGVLWCLCQQ